MDKAKMKLGMILTLSIIAVLISGIVIAEKSNNNKNKPFKLPPGAVQVSENVFSLGKAKDVDGRIVEGFAFIDKRKENAKPSGSGGTGTKCYSFLAKGAKWKTLEPWVVNPANTRSLSSDFVFSNLAFDIQKWEDASLTNILGVGSINTSTLVADEVSPDGKNEVYFGDIVSPGAIAVTIVWGIFSGPPFARELVEWDQVYDQVDFDWNSTGEAGKMDFENIATHELGHSVGMGHPPSECTEETMYAFASLGETKKRSLNSGDIAGIDQLY